MRRSPRIIGPIQSDCLDGLVVPATVCARLGLVPGDLVELRVEGDQIVIQRGCCPKRVKRQQDGDGWLIFED